MSGAAGTDKLQLQNNYSGLTITPGQQSITVGAQRLSFDTSLEDVEVVDSAATTVLATASASSMQFDSVNFSVQATGVADLRNAVINIASGKFTLTSAGVLGVLQTSVQSLEVSNSGTGSVANVIVAYAGDLHISGSGISSNGASITVTASPTGGGSITMDDSVVINAGTGNVAISAPGNITLSSVQTSTGTVSITSTSGAIVKGSTLNPNLVGGAGSSFALRAAGGIGTPTDPLNTAIPVLAYQNSIGDVSIRNTGGLRITSVDGLATSTNTGTTTLVATSPIVFAVSTTQASLLVQATESAPANYDSITVNAGVTVTAISGNLIFEAGDAIFVASGATVQSHSGEIIFRSGLNDTDGSGAMTLNGIIQVMAIGQIITLDLNQQQSAAQSSTGALIASSLRLISNGNAAGSFLLGESDLNDVGTLAASTAGSIQFKDLDDLTIGLVGSSSGIAAISGVSTVNGVSEGGAVSIAARSGLTVSQAIRTSPVAGPGSLSLGTVTLTSINSTIVITDNADIHADGSVSITAPQGIQTAGAVVTSSDDVAFNSPVNLTDSVSVDTGGGTITFDGSVNGSEDLTLTAGTGNIDFNAAVGLVSRLDQLRIVSVANASFDAAVRAESILQDAGTATTTFSGPIDTNTTAGVNITGTNLVLNGGLTTTSSGVLTTSLTGTASIGGSTTNSVDAAVSINAVGTITVGASAALTSNAAVLLKTTAASVTLQGSATV
ncbi:MAG: beta strand repeat-containing protein, partial [Planctomycetota bacterium]